MKGKSYGGHLHVPHGVGNPELALQTSLVVPPERAALPAHVEVLHQSFAEAAADLRRGRERVAGLLGEHATLALCDYEPPRYMGEQWSASARLEISVDLTGLTSVEERMTRLDAALAKLYEHVAKQPTSRKKWSPKTSTILEAGALRLELLDPQAHRGRLLEQLATRLDALRGVSESPQWAPASLPCASTGLVQVSSRELSGIRLSLDLRFEERARSSL